MSAETFPEGTPVRIAGARGTYTVRRSGATADGSVLVFGGTPMRERYRAVRPERLRPAKKANR